MTSPDSLIAARLEPGERLLWAGAPRTGLRLQRSDLLMVPFSLFWGGFAFVWEGMALRTVLAAKTPAPAAYIFPLFGLPFVCIGLYLIVGRFFFEAYARARTAYGVTSQRIIIVREGFGGEVKSLQLRTLADVTLSESGDGSGTITFGAGNPLVFGRRRGPAVPAFVMIERAKAVYHQIHTAQVAAT